MRRHVLAFLATTAMAFLATTTSSSACFPSFPTLPPPYSLSGCRAISTQLTFFLALMVTSEAVILQPMGQLGID